MRPAITFFNIQLSNSRAPEAVLVEKYEQGYQKFKKFYPALKGLF